RDWARRLVDERISVEEDDELSIGQQDYAARSRRCNEEWCAKALIERDAGPVGSAERENEESNFPDKSQPTHPSFKHWFPSFEQRPGCSTAANGLRAALVRTRITSDFLRRSF